MHEAVVFGLFQDGNRLVVGDEVSTARLGKVFGHVTYADTPVAVVVGTAFVQFFASVAAAADAHCQVAFIALEPIGDMLDVGCLVLHRDGFFDGNHVHADTATAHGHHWRDLFQWQEGHALEKHGQLGVFVHQLHVHVCIFC